MEYEEGDIVLCTVERITGTIVFVKLDKTEQEGSIVFSEVAPGRIRNIRDYVVPKKKIICKILKINDRGGIHLSLRRVTPKEQKELRELLKQEKSYIGIIKSIIKKDPEKAIEKIKEEGDLVEVLEESKKDEKILEKILGKDAKKIIDIISQQKKKNLVIKKEIKVTTKEPNGIEKIKKILDSKEFIIRYISAGKYSIKLETGDAKEGNKKIEKFLEEIKEKGKKENLEIEYREK
jgi:translation initiation factor 2 alpha subunit (eIF-2alpha)